ncbi:hypothetical protein SAMN05421505_12562 [Sinosporangium album]|uniref:Uncharacterized protein n=1 Tax=Sinosporangium album TaxID=504805 RepID=A0A1G8G2Y1_9ACTN|nr:hypothetical protein SAMN05421505_12562 [Sinosporangium album]
MIFRSAGLKAPVSADVVTDNGDRVLVLRLDAGLLADLGTWYLILPL